MADKCFTNRELSWLKFNSRVLEEAADASNPLCERLNFISIYNSNLDEFIMVRIGALLDQINADVDEEDNKTGMSSKEQFEASLVELKKLNKRRDELWHKNLITLKSHGIEIVKFADNTDKEKRALEIYFDNEIKPLISPQTIGKRQPFPFVHSEKIYAIVVLETKNMNEKIGIIPCSGPFDRLIEVGHGTGKYMLTEELILHFIGKIFDRYKVKAKTLIRIIRNADIDADEAMYDYDYDDYRAAMSEILKKRKKLRPVYMEYTREIKGNALKTICKNLGIKEKQTYRTESPLELGFIGDIRGMLSSDKSLFYPEYKAKNSVMIDEKRGMIEQIREHDVMLHYPYDSMRPFLRLLKEAGEDDAVVSIKMTLYRVAKYSKVVEALIDAAENGKEVVVLVELRARFDESNNIGWSKMLEEAGCRVIYGLDEYKVHSKACLITYKNGDKVEYITQIGTGNYNEKTANVYTDLCLMTADHEIGTELMTVLNELAMGQTMEETTELLVSPKCLQDKIIDYIDDEIKIQENGGTGYVCFKLNAITDKKIMDKLIDASKAGVKIDMIVRGICCLTPGIKGETENIRIISIVGRFLEHSRVYIFGTRDREKMFISSADLMTRNTLRRVEIAAPIKDEKIKDMVHNIIDTTLKDNTKAWVLQSDGDYVKPALKRGVHRIEAQKKFMEQHDKEVKTPKKKTKTSKKSKKHENIEGQQQLEFTETTKNE